eukprot:275449_1
MVHQSIVDITRKWHGEPHVTLAVAIPCVRPLISNAMMMDPCVEIRTLTNAIYYVYNYFPLGNRYTNAGIIDIYNQEGDPCDNCPWDHSKCTYDSAAATSYDSDWTNMPTTETTNGLCIGCGNKYYEICNTGLNNGLGDSCVSNKKNVGCYYDFEANSAGVAQDIQICDPNNDGDNGLEDPDICTLGDQCRYECATCYCQDEGVDRFKACETECDDGLGRNVTGGCLGDDYFAQYIEDVGGCTGGGGGGSGDSGANQAQLSMFVFLLSYILAIIVS